MRIKKLGLLFLLILVFSSFVMAQEESDATIRAIVVFAEGTEVSLFRNGVYTSLSARDDKLIGLGLFSGDYIQTGVGTRIELQFLPGTSRIDVAENTSFTILVKSDEVKINLTYGRIKASINENTSKLRFQLESNLVIARTAAAEFGFDVLSSSRTASSLQAQLSCFEGFLTLRLPSAASDATSFESVRLDKDNTFLIYKGTLPPEASPSSRILADTVFLSLNKVPESINNFWRFGSGRIQLSMPELKQNDFYRAFSRIQEPQTKPEELTRLVRSYLQAPSIASGNDGQGSAKAEAAPILTKPLSLADQIAPLSMGEVFAIRQKPIVDQADLLKKAGLIVAGLGLAADLVGIGFYHLGNEVLGFDLATAQLIGQITTISGSAVFTSGLVMYFIGLFQ